MKDNSNITQEFLETIERYFNGSMATEERKTFEERLKNEPEFKTQVEDVKALLFGIEEQSLKEKLEEFHQDLPLRLEKQENHPRANFLLFRKIAIAAVFVIALGSLWYYMDSSNERLYNNHFRPDPGLPTTMGSSDNFEFYDAMVNYKQGDYKKAIGKWVVLHDKAPQNDTINYFLGAAYLANKMEDKAIPYLDEVTYDENSIFKNEAYYYLGFVYLKKEDIALAKKNFKLSNMDNAKLILSKLKD